MNSEDREQQQLSPAHHHLRRRNHYMKRVEAAVSKPKAYVVLLIAVFILGYLSHSHPLLSQTASDVHEHNSFPEECGQPVHHRDVRRTIEERVFNGSSPWAGFPPEHVKPLLWQEWNKGWGSNAAVFEHLIDQVRPKTIVEVGTFLGASATHMAALTKKLGLETQIVCIDDFRGWPGYYDEEKSLKMVNGDSLLMYQFMQNVVKANASESIIMLPFSAATALGGLCDWGVYGDLVEVDAAHDFHSAWVDINHAFKVLKRPRGVLFGHDYAWEGVRKAVHIFARLHGFQVRIDGEHWILY
ncbi:S-adenosyl-L-methionine-dependent methyltransferases superfamily protein [Perilla frutescens var. frutescens]|nr:S-adenosyl-L-methionine-dependent methyltransferases superfamily protein [Perilla frutescens var. frutescens]